MSSHGLRLSVLLRRYPWPWLLCAMLLFCAGWLHFVFTQQLRTDLDQLHQAVVSDALPAPQGDAAASAPEQTNLQRFQDTLLGSKDLPVVTAVMTEESRRLHLIIERADYQVTHSPGSGFSGYRVTLPIKGEFGVLQEFVLAVLQRLPSAALRNIKINRDSVGAPTVEAQMEWVVFCKEVDLP